MTAVTEPPMLDTERHVKYWRRCHSTYLPSPYTAADSTRMLFACFTVAAMDLLSMPLTPQDRVAIRAWVLSLQHPDGGFCGSSTHALPGQDARRGTANLAATFFALILLGMAADGEGEAARGAFAGVKRRKLLRWLRALQRDDGSFGQNMWEGEVVGGKDTRHSYIASCVRWMLRGSVAKGGDGEEEADVDVDKMIGFIRQGQTYDGGLAEASTHEHHAGYAYCSVAALALLDRPLDWSLSPPASGPSPGGALEQGIPDREAVLSFLAHRQFVYMAQEEEDAGSDDEDNHVQSRLGELSITDDGCCRHVGFNGRLNKKADTCYVWWVSATLALLGEPSLTNAAPSRRMLLELAQHTIGGFPKNVGAPPDLYHSYLSLAALATMGEPGLKEFDVGLCCSMETTRKIQRAREGLLEDERRERAGMWEEDGFWDRPS